MVSGGEKGQQDERRAGPISTAAQTAPNDMPLPAELDLRPVARWPTRLSDATAAAVCAAPLPVSAGKGDSPISADTEIGTVPSPRTSIIVATYDNLVFNRLCLESLLHTTRDASCEIVVVDNGSTDGTAEYLRQLANRNPQIRVIFNACNMGFAVSNNQALAAACGEFIVLLNNDTIVPPGWLDGLLAHLHDPGVGLVGPVTNRAGNEARIETSYKTYGEFLDFAADRARRYRRQRSELRVATMFCAAVRRAVYEEIGPLDERFEIGLFEDDDYSMRTRAAGYRVVCAEDVFVHHFGQALTGKLAEAGQYGESFHANRRRWEAKWNVTWQPYGQRESPAYQELVELVRQFVEEHVPAGAKILVVSKGDDALLELARARLGIFRRAKTATMPDTILPMEPAPSVTCRNCRPAAHNSWFFPARVCGGWIIIMSCGNTWKTTAARACAAKKRARCTISARAGLKLCNSTTAWAGAIQPTCRLTMPAPRAAKSCAFWACTAAALR